MSSYLSFSFGEDVFATLGIISQWSKKGNSDYCEVGERLCALPGLITDKIMAVVKDVRESEAWSRLSSDVISASNGIAKTVKTFHAVNVIKLNFNSSYLEGFCSATDVFCSIVDGKSFYEEYWNGKEIDETAKPVLAMLKSVEVVCLVALGVMGCMALTTSGAAMVAAIGSRGALVIATVALACKLGGDEYQRVLSRRSNRSSDL